MTDRRESPTGSVPTSRVVFQIDDRTYAATLSEESGRPALIAHPVVTPAEWLAFGEAVWYGVNEGQESAGVIEVDEAGSTLSYRLLIDGHCPTGRVDAALGPVWAALEQERADAAQEDPKPPTPLIQENNKMDYICPTCRKAHPRFEEAGSCCQADYVECPLAELPEEAELGAAAQYGYGTVFTGRWELCLNGTPHDQPVRVYPLPPLMSQMVKALAEARYQQGVREAQATMRRACGL